MNETTIIYNIDERFQRELITAIKNLKAKLGEETVRVVDRLYKHPHFNSDLWWYKNSTSKEDIEKYIERGEIVDECEDKDDGYDLGEILYFKHKISLLKDILRFVDENYKSDVAASKLSLPFHTAKILSLWGKS